MPSSAAEPRPGLVPLEEMLAALGVESVVVTEYVELGFVAPAPGTPGRAAFTVGDLWRLARALRLARELELHPAGAVLLVELLEEREALARRVRSLEQLAGLPD